MKRGEIWMCVWPTDPSKKERPVLIVSNDHRNSTASFLDIIVVKITSLHRTNGTEKVVNQFEDLVVQFRKESIIRCGSIFSVEKKNFKTIIGQLQPTQIDEINEKLKRTLALA